MLTQNSKKGLIVGVFSLLSLYILLFRLRSLPVPNPLDSSFRRLLVADIGREVPLLYDYLLRVIPFSWLLPVLFGVFSLALLCFYGPKYFGENSFGLAIFAFLPVTLTTFTAHSSASLFFFLILIALFAYLAKLSWFSSGTFTLFLLLSCWASPLAGALSAVAFFMHAISQKKLRVLTGTLAVCSTIGLFLSDATIVERGLFSEFGAPFGFSFSLFILALVLVEWGKANTSRLLFFAFLLTAAFFIPDLRLIVILPVALYCGEKLSARWSQEWVMAPVKTASFWILFCIALFLVLTQVKLLIESEPYPELVDFSQMIADEVRPGRVLTTPGIEHSVEYFSRRSVLAAKTSDPIFQHSTVNSLSSDVHRENIRFILLTPEAKQELGSRGIVQVLDNSQRFVLLSEKSGFELWLVLQEFV